VFNQLRGLKLFRLDRKKGGGTHIDPPPGRSDRLPFQLADRPPHPKPRTGTRTWSAHLEPAAPEVDGSSRCTQQKWITVPIFQRNRHSASFHSVKLRDDATPPVVSGITWDITAPSYARPLAGASSGGVKPGFIVCDVNLRGVLNENDVALFVRKHDLASAPLRVAPIMPFLLADGFTSAGFRLARTKGILATTIAHLFGEDVAKALRDLITLLTDTGATASANPEHIERVLNSLTKIEGAANNLRGALFEIVVGSLVKDVDGGYLRAGEKWTELQSRRSAEIDVLLDRPDDKGVLVIECKSKIPGSRVSLEEVQKWRDDRVPLIHKILRSENRFSEKSFTFELWTNGPIATDALDWLRSQPAPADCVLGWKDGEAMKVYVDKTTQPALRKAMKEHYFRHPLTKVTTQSRTVSESV
jgi:hypothetical protein